DFRVSKTQGFGTGLDGGKCRTGHIPILFSVMPTPPRSPPGPRPCPEQSRDRSGALVRQPRCLGFVRPVRTPPAPRTEGFALDNCEPFHFHSPGPVATSPRYRLSSSRARERPSACPPDNRFAWR